MKKKIYLADDEKNIRDLITMFLKNEGYEVQSFENGDELYKAFLNSPADMIILDIMMPGTDGLGICSKIRESHNVPIIMVSARDSELDRVTGITMGSDDYLAKPFSPMELVARVKAIFRRIGFEHINDEINIDSSATNEPAISITGNTAAVGTHKYGDLILDMNIKTATKNGKNIDFTPLELSFMAYMVENCEKAVSREELLKNVWQYDEFGIDCRATDDVVKRLRKKLSDNQSCVLIKSVWGHGFRLEVEEFKPKHESDKKSKRK